MALVELKSNLSTAFKKAPVDFINNPQSGATGFTENFTNPNESKYIGIENGVYNYPFSVRGGRLMQPSPGVALFPGPQNFIDDDSNGASGFTLRFTNRNESKFIGIQGGVFNYPSTVLGGRLMQPSIDSAKYPGPQNFLENASSGARGFSLFNSLGNSKFLGIRGDQYTYPTSVRGNRLMKPSGNVAAFPGPQNFIDNTSTGAQGFTLRFTNPNDSKFIGISSQSYSYPRTVLGGRLMKPNQSPAFPGPVNFINDKETGVKGFTLRFTNPNESKFLGISGQSYYYPNVHGRRLMKPNGSATFPGPQNFINDELTGAKGFNLNFNSITDSKFLGINGLQYTYPDTVLGNRLMKPRNSTEFPGPQNFINDLNSGAEGFTLQFNNPNESKFIGISGETYTYPKSVRAGRLMNPPKSIIFPGPQNYFDDNRWGSKGFTLNTDDSTKFLGIEGRQFTYPKTVLPIHKNSVREVPMGNSKFNQGIATLENQLGTGTPFKYLRDGAFTTKIFSAQGYNEKLRYTDYVRITDALPENSLLYKKATEQNSPSAIEEQYKKFNLREEAFNFQYIDHPLILRGIQRKGKEKPNRWGVDALVNFDSGLIRGGITAVVDRIASDTVRIAKWMATPKGILWVVKQIGLGLTNPKVEKAPGSSLLGIPQTKVHLGVTSLLSVAGNPLGLHFTRHGIPFLNEKASYEQVIKTNQAVRVQALIKEPYSRLIQLKDSYGLDPGYNNLAVQAANVLKNFVAITTGSPILSGFSGPNSVYGVGNTRIHRVVNTTSDSLIQASRLSFTPKYSILNQYAAEVSSAKHENTTKNEDRLGKTAKTVDVNTFSEVATLTSSPKVRDSLKTRIGKINETATPGGSESSQIAATNPAKLATTTDYDASRPAGPTGRNLIAKYATLAYNQIPKDSNSKQELKKDFRVKLLADTKHFTGKHSNDEYYNQYNLETKYGFGSQGKPGVTNKLEQRGKGSFIYEIANYDAAKDDSKIRLGNPEDRFRIAENTQFLGDKINAIDVNKRDQYIEDANDDSKLYPKGVRDFVKLIFEDPDSGAGVPLSKPDPKNPSAGINSERKTAMVFRGTITGFSDSFSPGWNPITIMGRPDSAYLYSSFDRNISFTFTVAATSRQEMIPIWRKLNYLATYTMPDFNGAGGRPSGPMLRITLGDLFNRCPGFLNSLTYTVPEDATWDIADDADEEPSKAKQLPMMIEVSIDFKVINDFRPQQHGRAYYLGEWLNDAEGSENFSKIVDYDPSGSGAIAPVPELSDADKDKINAIYVANGLPEFFDK